MNNFLKRKQTRQTGATDASFAARDAARRRGAILTEGPRFLVVRIVISLCKSIRLRNINRNSSNSGDHCTLLRNDREGSKRRIEEEAVG